MLFNFTNLRKDTPSHLICLAANCDEFHVQTADGSRHFRIRKTAEENGEAVFTLWAWSQPIDGGKHDDEENHFVMRSDLGRLLKLIGCTASRETMRRTFKATRDTQGFLYGPHPPKSDDPYPAF